MTQAKYGLVLLIFLILPPVANLLESIMIIHMHMQMPLLVIAGLLMAPFFQAKFPSFFNKWNENGIPGIMLFIIIMSYWSIPRAMDDALAISVVEYFKFVSLPFLVGVPLRDSWKKLSDFGKNLTFIIFLIQFTVMGIIYIASPDQLCNNYIRAEQVTLGWGFITMAIAIFIYLVQLLFINPSDYE
ncbi:hypothetical protein SAMN05216389_10611 [Oceanobacillus limi]|uniref:Uncharacterized protein n=1 Tax=Oceanobacillus limi TaxID=930131 RepID=A0A1I0C3F3_9BACI|nr:hypothetical protein [Oceanobacillus limi]SET13974.1 hypothetical protein SAMN05216389_10611 [Oceanobacillus limi]